MISLDTNVLVRAIADEIDADATTTAQRKRAQALLSSGRQLFVSITVILKLELVLRGAYDMPSDEIASLFEDMIKVENLTIDRVGAVSQAIAWYRQELDFSDALHMAQSGLCAGLATFDEQFLKAARRLNLKSPVSAPN